MLKKFKQIIYEKLDHSASMKSFFAIALWAMAIPKIIINQAAVTGVKWNRRLQDFEQIPGVPSYKFEKQRRIFDSRQEETHNFNGGPLQITYHQDPGFFEFYDNDTKVRGIYGDMWTVLSEFLNFTLVLTRVNSNSTGVGYKKGAQGRLFDYVACNQTDVIPKAIVYSNELGAVTYTPIFSINRLRIFAHVHWKEDSNWIFDVFTAEVWALICIFIVTLTLASIVTQKVLIRNRVLNLQDRSYFAHLFNTFAWVCNQGTAPDNTAGSGAKMLAFTVGIFSWLSLAAYSACLINSMTVEVIDSPFNDLGTLLDKTDRQILVVADSLAHLIFLNPNAPEPFNRIVRAKRFSVESNINVLYRKVCLHSNKYVLFDEEDAVATRGKKLCRLIPVDVPHYPLRIASVISGRVKNKKTLNIGIMKLQEFGVLDGIKKRYMLSKIVNRKVRQATRVFVDVHRASVIFAILGIGSILSIVICVTEIIVFSLRKRKDI